MGEASNNNLANSNNNFSEFLSTDLTLKVPTLFSVTLYILVKAPYNTALPIELKGLFTTITDCSLEVFNKLVLPNLIVSEFVLG